MYPRRVEVLLELPSTQNKTQFRDEVSRAVGSDAADVRDSISKTTLEIRDMDECATEDKVRQAIARAGVAGELVIRLTNNRGQRLATVAVHEVQAIKLLKTGKLKVSWVICRVRRRIPLVRCFRFLGYGHYARDCKETEGSETCFKCGHCALCAKITVKVDEQKHILGTTKFWALRLSLEGRKLQLENGRKN